MAYLTAAPGPSSGCFLCAARTAADDRERLVVARRERAFLMLNAYPYASGHLMAVIHSHVGAIERADSAELHDALALVREATAALGAEYRADGFNIGVNQGRVAGAGVPDHLHVHVVPRWQGDMNFMPVLGDVRVLPETLDQTWQRLRDRLARTP
jgi:ATP adenylyltransferase